MLIKDVVALTTVPDMVDASGNPLLLFHMNCSEPGPDAPYQYREGWAKKREYVGAPLAKLDSDEQARCYGFDRNAGTNDQMQE